MTLFSRLLLILPFTIVTISYCKLYDPNENYQGIAHSIFNGFFILLFLLSILLTLRGIIHKRRLDKTKFEPVTLSLTILTIIFLFSHHFIGNHTTGEIWITAENKNVKQILSKQYLILRKNGNFTVKSVEADFGCSISGKYKRLGDTISLDQTTVDKTNSKITSKYLIQKTDIIPLVDPINKITFNITKKN